MKTKKIKLLIGLAGIVLLAVLFSCDNPLALGARLDLDGPVVNFTAPVPRKAVPSQFVIEGTITDHSGINRMVVKTESGNVGYHKQWRYNNNRWEISVDYGASWAAYAGAEWKGNSKNAVWKINIDLGDADDGEYIFSVQAWDVAGSTDDNSYKTLTLILDRDPPKVEVSNPYLSRWNDDGLQELHIIADDDMARRDPANIGKYQTRQFDLQWQIEDQHDIWSIDIRFYKWDVEIDNDPATPLPANHIFSHFKNLPPPPDVPNPSDNLNPNGSVKVPKLTGARGDYDGGGRLENPITEKTTIKVVASCYDAAGNPNQEKTLGYFVYWPLANEPWIVFPAGMKETYDDLDDVHAVYPGRDIRAAAYHAHGVSNVVYKIFKSDEAGANLGQLGETRTIANDPRFGNVLSTIFPWEFSPPVNTGYYLITAITHDDEGLAGEEHKALFKVQDLSYPDFPQPPQPPASEPLFMHIDSGNIVISGTVTDVTEIESLYMVWINPQSKNYAAMSQLAYFRDKDYGGWAQAGSLLPGNSANETAAGSFTPYDTANPNRLWNVAVQHEGQDSETGRQVFSYSQTINLPADLNIGLGSQPLISQVFLLRAENPDGKCTIITYAPQGDDSSPVIDITNVVITRSGEPTIVCIPGEFEQIRLFKPGDVLTITGTWREDSTGYLDINTYFTPGFVVAINGNPLTGSGNTSVSVSPSGNAVSGTWTASATVGTGAGFAFTEDNLKDVLVVSAEVRDIGGNFSEAGGSWLVESDALRLNRISSENADQVYKSGDVIEIFLEFNKPVQLKNSGAPVLTLNTGGTAVYKSGQVNPDARQYFEYTVAAGHTTGSSYLNVTGMVPGVVYTDSSYPFTWQTGGSPPEEIRILAPGTAAPAPGLPYETHELPVTAIVTDPDYIYTLIAGKNIGIDTAAPVASSISANTPAGWYTTGAEIYITVTFDKPVITGATMPRLALSVSDVASSAVYTDPSNIKVSGNTITFMYRVISGDTTNGSDIVVTDYIGDITDPAGNPLDPTAISGLASRTLTGIVIDTIPPGIPTVRILSAANIGNVVQNNVNGVNITGVSTTFEVNLSSLYNQNLWYAIQGSGTGDEHLYDIEYSINNGGSWVKAPNTANTPVSLTQPGMYQIMARQTDRAGNVSGSSQPVNFTWDPGNLVTRITSVNSNGTYTNKDGREIVTITVTFRKPVRFAGTPQIELNAESGAANVIANASAVPAGLVSSLDFTYTVGAGHSVPVGSGVNPPAGDYLDVLSFMDIDAWDGLGLDRVDVSAFIDLPPVTGDALLAQNKQLRVETGPLTVGVPDRTSGSVQPNDEYTAVFNVQFNHNIEGTSDLSRKITVRQSAAGYRLPAVISEEQYNRYRNVPNFNDFYTRGTNGYIYNVPADRYSDTSGKYVLNFNHNTIVAPNSSAPTGSPGRLAYDFLEAERIEFDASSSAVTISGNIITLTFSGSDTFKVPGADYELSIPAGFVYDNLDNENDLQTWVVTIPGISRAYIRINRVQDTLALQAGGAAAPSITAIQPFQAQVRMDCRTPGSAIMYTTLTTTTSEAAVNYSTYTVAAPPADTDYTAQPDDPADGTGTAYESVFAIGADNVYQGYQWYGRAIGRTGTAGSYQYSSNGAADEMAFRTVVTFEIVGLPPGNTGQDFSPGDHLWIRGGDNIGSSNVPGFPITWSDNYTTLYNDGKRAGIRLMTLDTVGADLNTSTWRWVTWEINIMSYINFYLGRDRTDRTITTVEAWQYGPELYASQRANWTADKDQYPVFPGQHLWLHNRNPDYSGPPRQRGDLNFSGTMLPRPTPTTTTPGLIMSSGWVTP